MAHTVVNWHTLGFEPFVKFFNVGRRIDAPGDVGNDLGVALASFGQSELVVLDVGIGCEKDHPPGVLAVLDEPENVFVKCHHFLEIVDI
jgi:hypothetical protein